MFRPLIQANLMDLALMFDDAHNGAFFKIVGTKIQDKLREVRQSRPEENARRWGWELLQNAKDVAHEGRPVRVAFNLDEADTPRLVARHTGRPFQPDHLFYLIVQTSSKDRPTGDAEPATTGRYGTGFLTTHLLSPVVDVAGVLDAPGAAPARFSVELDRSGATLDALTAGVKRALAIRDQLESLPRVASVDPDAYNTAFTYRLGDDGLGVARSGMEDLHRSVPLTLAFTEGVGEVTVQNVTYQRVGRSALAENVERVHVVARDASGHCSNHWFVVARGEKTAMAVPVDGETRGARLLPLGADVPRLFCDFPLLGSESFPLPGAVNSSWFYPDDARSGVYLENDSDAEVAVNRAALAEVPALLGRLLETAEAEGWHDRYHLAAFEAPTGLAKRAAAWYQATVLTPSRDALLTAPLVETEDGTVLPLRKPLGETDPHPLVWLPCHTKSEVRDGLWRFAAADPLKRGRLPKADHVHAWSALAWADCAQLDLAGLVKWVSAPGTVEALAEQYEMTTEEAVCWLGELASFLVQHDQSGLLRAYKCRVQVPSSGGRYGWSPASRTTPVLPNQLGAFCSSATLYLDGEIAEALKDIAADLDDDIRAVLLDSAVCLEERHVKGTKSQQDAAQSIEAAVKDQVKGNRTDATRRAFRALYLWIKEHDAEARKLFGMWLYENRALLVPPEDVIDLLDRVPQLEEENAALREEAQTLQMEHDALRQEAEAATAAAMRFQQLTTWLEAEGVGFDALPALLGGLKELTDGDRQGGMSDEDRELAAFVDEIRQFQEVEITSPAAFQEFVQSRPDLFLHRAETDRYLLFLQKAERARTAVMQHLAGQEDLYNVKDWIPCPRRPTVVLGVRRLDRTHGRPLLIVVRPSDGGRVIFYHQEELVALADPESELWTEDPSRGIRRLTLGDVLTSLRDRMGVNQVPVG